MSESFYVVLFLGFFTFAAAMTIGIWKSRMRPVHDEVSKAWPTTEATIQKAAKEPVGDVRSSVELPFFAFSYVVRGEYYLGRFALAACGDRADTLLREMIDRKFFVRYDPNHPSRWDIPEETIEGCEVRYQIET